MESTRSSGQLARGIALVACLAASPAAAQDLLSAFGPGEQTTYRIAVLGQSAGTMRVTVGARTDRFGATVLPVVVLTRTDDTFGATLLRYKLVSFWEPARSICLGNEMAAVEYGRWRRERIVVDAATGKATVWKEKQGHDARRTTLEVGRGALDIVSALLALRNQPLAVGQSFAFPVFSGTDAFTLTGTVEAAEHLETALGPRTTLRVRMKTRFTGGAASKRDLVVWMTDDPLHLLVRAETEFLFGAARAELERYDGGQRYPLQARAGTPARP